MGQVWFQGRMAAVKWFGSGKADEKTAIAWEVNTRKELAAVGEVEERRDIALRFLRGGLSVEQIARGTGLTVEEVRQLRCEQ